MTPPVFSTLRRYSGLPSVVEYRVSSIKYRVVIIEIAEAHRAREAAKEPSATLLFRPKFNGMLFEDINDIGKIRLKHETANIILLGGGPWIKGKKYSGKLYTLELNLITLLNWLDKTALMVTGGVWLIGMVPCLLPPSGKPFL